MDELKMLTQEELAELTDANIMTVSMWRETGLIKSIKTGRNFMFSQAEVKEFQKTYAGYDISIKVMALRSKEIVEGRKKEKVYRPYMVVNDNGNS